MPTVLEDLKSQLARNEAKHGPDDWFVRQLRSQVQGMERQLRQDHKTEQAVFGATMGNLSGNGPAMSPLDSAADPMRPAVDAIEKWLADNKDLLSSDKPTA